MYSEQKILMRLEAAKKSFGWVPERHSVEEIEAFNKVVKRVEFVDYKKSTAPLYVDPEKLTSMERRFILNEIMMCACDADYWLTRYAYIRDETNTIRRFQW